MARPGFESFSPPGSSRSGERGHPVRQRAKLAQTSLEERLRNGFALRAQADRMSALRNRDMTPQTIDEVLMELDKIILRARNERDRLGFFATLYRNVTRNVKQGIAAGLFEDGPRMEKLEVTFANRYLAALGTFRRGEPFQFG